MRERNQKEHFNVLFPQAVVTNMFSRSEIVNLGYSVTVEFFRKLMGCLTLS